MRTTDLFKSNRAADKITESIEKVFGKKLNLESFDLAQLEDARNKLRTQIHTVRSESGFNENLENDAFTQAQWMLDAINSEIAERQEFVADPGVATLDEAPADVYEMEYMFTGDDGETGDGTITYEVVDGEIDPTSLKGYCEGDGNNKLNDDWCTEMIQPGGYEHEEALAAVQEDYAEQSGNQDDEGGETDDAYALASAGFGSDEDYESVNNEAYINNAKDAVNILADLRKQSKMAELGQGDPVRPNQLVNDLWDVMQWIENNMKESIETESKNTGEDMTKLQEGEVQQATAVVTAKTMVDRVGRWIEELSGMENDQLIQLGDSIRDEMGQEQAKAFISTVAPAVQQALENLKSTRETLATGVRMLTGEEQGAELLGTDPAPEAGSIDDLAGPAEPDAMNAEPDMGDEFAAAEPAVGGAETAGREKRESIDYQNSLLKVLAG
jgi:hypothetical protein